MAWLVSAWRNSLTWKVFGVCFGAVHVPLIGLCVYLAFGQPVERVPVLVIALVATLLASGLALMAIRRLVRPIDLIIRAVDDYRVERVVTTIDVGGTDEIRRLAEGINAMIIEQEVALDTYKRQANSDSLTGLGNRRWLNEAAAAELYRARRIGQNISVIVFDLDHFKQINDTFGHHAGDQVLMGVAEIARRQLRPYDLLARIGGEEFCIVVSDGDVGVAYAAAERIRQAIADWSPPAVEGRNVSASFGVHHGNPKGETLKAMIAAADTQLYAAKESGRNRVRMATPA
jgi:diguanylate cyclase (GGDEF)-like protein